MGLSRFAIACWLTISLAACATPASPDRVLTIPFDNHRNQVAIEAMVGGEPLTFLIDTAVTPSVIDLATAERLDLPIDRSNAGEAQGVGTARAAVFPSELRGMAIQGRGMEPAVALALDLTGLSERYGKPIHGILGQSFLEGRRLLIDYPGATVHLLGPGDDAERFVRTCRLAYRIPLARYRGTTTPVVQIVVDGMAMPATLDTGGSYSVEFMKDALPEHIASLGESGRQVRVTGARGDASQTEFVLPVPIQLGPFAFESRTVTISDRPGSPETRQANIGNALLSEFRLLLDYRREVIGFFRDCG